MSDHIQELWCERGEHDWKRDWRPGRAPGSCPDHPKSQAQLDQEDEAYRQAVQARADARIDMLETNLKAHGLHLSQQEDWW